MKTRLLLFSPPTLVARCSSSPILSYLPPAPPLLSSIFFLSFLFLLLSPFLSSSFPLLSSPLLLPSAPPGSSSPPFLSSPLLHSSPPSQKMTQILSGCRLCLHTPCADDIVSQRAICPGGSKEEEEGGGGGGEDEEEREEDEKEVEEGRGGASMLQL